MLQVVMNGRILSLPSNGQRRVAEEINARLGLEIVAPAGGAMSGAKGHLWEQLVLPVKLMGRPLWSPSTSAPVLYPNQVVTIHDIGFVDAPQFFTARFAAAYSKIVGRVARTARHLVTVSEFSRQRLVEHYSVPESRVSCVYPGVSEAFRPRSASEIRSVLAGYHLEGRPYLVAFAGSDPRKNTGALIEAWTSLGKKRGDARLVLFGRISNAAVFGSPQKIQDAPGTLRVGAVPDEVLAALFSGSNGLIFPSLYEGFGLPIVEAAACGAPIACSRVASMPEVAPGSAMLIDPARPGEIAEAMLACLQTQPDAAMRRSIAAEMERFSWDDAARAYGRIFADVFD